jgi:SpoVK/Ycf46/Vps4 family AAA+-type ATPase
MQSLPSLTLYNYITQLKDKEVYLIGATSASEKLDILTKPGIFYKQIKINNPDEAQRIEIIEKVLHFYNHNVG